MKIAIFSDTYLPDINGVATCLSNLVAELRKANHQVKIVTCYKKTRPNDENIIEVPAIEWKRLYKISSGVFYSPKGNKKLKEFNPDVIHINTELMVGKFGYIFAKSNNIPVTYTIHTFWHEYIQCFVSSEFLIKISKKFVIKYIKMYSKRASLIVVPSQKIFKSLQDHGYTEKKIIIVPNGLDVTKMQHFSNKIIDDLKKKYLLLNSFNLVYSGRICKEKNTELLFAYFAYFIKKYPLENTKLVMVGTAPKITIYYKLAKKYAIHNFIVFTGRVNFDEIQNYYRLGDVFVTLSEWETQGMTYFEAFANKLPIIYHANDKNDTLESLPNIDKMASAVNSKEAFCQAILKWKHDLSFQPKKQHIQALISQNFPLYDSKKFCNEMVNAYELAIKLHKEQKLS